MKLKEPNLEGWNKYDPKEIPEEKRRLILRSMPNNGTVPMYDLITILNKQTGYCFTEIGSTFWNRWKEEGTHWAWLDELDVAKGKPIKGEDQNVHTD